MYIYVCICVNVNMGKNEDESFNIMYKIIVVNWQMNNS